MSTTFDENAYEQALIELFEQMGYRHVYGPDVERDRRNPLHEEVLEESLRRVNPHLGEAGMHLLLNKVHDVDGAALVYRNEKWMDMLQNGVAVEDKDSKNNYRIKMAQLVDYAHPENNLMEIVNQWTVEEFSVKRCDLVVMVNGLPLAVIELKSPSNESVGEDDAYLQLRNYQKQVPSLFVYNCMNVTSDMLTSKAGTITSSADRYMEWKSRDGVDISHNAADYSVFFQGLFEPKRFLDIIHHFICFNHSEAGIGKILAGYHQYFAVNKALERTAKALESDGKIGVFWHTQGSGKSLSMVFLAHQLIQRHSECTLVVVTDRKDLDQQLYAQFCRCKEFLRMDPSNATCRQDLVDLLKDRKSGGIIFTTIQKFEEGEGALSRRKNIIVMTDEAHRSQYGDEHWDEKSASLRKGMAQKMREALPHASFIGFTGTPISDRDRDTQEVFGDYIDIYDMTQAVEDGATRPVYYESRVIKLDLDEDVTRQLDQEFDQLVQMGATEEQVQHTKQDLSRLEQVLGAEETIDSLVRDIVRHYEEGRANLLSGKAMIVSMTRSIGIAIYRKILELRPRWKDKVAVVMTSGNQDPEDWADIIGNEAHKKELARRFKDDQDPLKIVIVRDMWLTGFDVPSLATMYVYKAMSGHNLMQAIARVNRVFPGKEGGLIVDYIGIAQALKEAMHNYTQRDQMRFGDPNIAKTAWVKWKEELEICRDLLHGYDYSSFDEDDNTTRAHCIQGALNYLLSLECENKKKPFIEHSQLLHNAQTLCHSMLTRKEKREVALMDVLRVMLQRFQEQSKQKVSRREINDRISNMLKQSIKSSGVVNLFEDTGHEFSLFDERFMAELQAMKHRNIAIELLKKLLKNKISSYKQTNLVQSERFSAMLTDALNRYIKGMLTNEEILQEMMIIAQSIKQQEEEGNELGLTREEKAFYDALTKPQAVRDFYTNEELRNLTIELTEQLRKNRTIDWNRKESARAQMRVMIKRLLKKYKYPPEGAEEALQTVMDQCDNWADQDNNLVEEVEHDTDYFTLPDYPSAVAAEHIK